jgi:hypothetical protein
MQAAWLNRIGLFLQFTALFLVTPEIFGLERMKAIADRFSRAQRRFWTKTESLVDDSASFAAFVGAVMRLTFFSVLIILGTLIAFLVTRSITSLEAGGVALESWSL